MRGYPRCFSCIGLKESHKNRGKYNEMPKMKKVMKVMKRTIILDDPWKFLNSLILWMEISFISFTYLTINFYFKIMHKNVLNLENWTCLIIFRSCSAKCIWPKKKWKVTFKYFHDSFLIFMLYRMIGKLSIGVHGS